MALLFMDSFDHYASADLLEKWTYRKGDYFSIGAYGRNGTNGLLCTNTSQTSHLAATVLGGVDEVIVGFAVKPIVITAAGASLLSFGGGTTWECGVAVLPDATLQPFRGTANFTTDGPGSMSYLTLIGSASSSGLQQGVWSYLEVRMKCHDSAGTCIIRLNGIEVLNLTGLDTLYSTSTLTRFAVASTGTFNTYFHIDDLVVMDTTGSLNNTFMGDVTISAIFPTGAGNSSGWTPSAGSNYDCVNETSPNDDTDYNATSVLTTKDLYAFADAPAGADIRAVQVLAAVRKGAEGPGQVKLVTRSNSTDYDGVAQGIGGTSYSYVREVYETDPATAVAWTEGGFNAAEFGLKKTG